MKAAYVLMFMAALSVVSAQLVSEPGRVGPHPVATGETPDHWQLTPAGLQVEIGDRPMGMATTPDGRYLLVSNNGQGVQSLVLFDTYTDKVVQEIPYVSPEALFLGVAVSKDGSRVYASAGGNDKVRVYNLDEQGLHELEPIMLDNNDEGDLYPAGVALSPDGKTLYVALNLDNSVAFIDTKSGEIQRRVRLSPPASEKGIGVLPYQLTLTPNGDKLYVSEQGKGFPVRNHYFADADLGSLVNVTGVGVLTTSQNRNAAEQFVAHLLSTGAQQHFTDTVYEYPLISGIETNVALEPIAEIVTPDLNLADLGLVGTTELLEKVGAFKLS